MHELKDINFIKLTTHATDRARQRHHISRATLQDMAQRSVMEGYSINDAPSKRIADYLRGKCRSNCDSVFGYRDFIFVFKDRLDGLFLMTTYKLPPNLRRTAKDKAKVRF